MPARGRGRTLAALGAVILLAACGAPRSDGSTSASSPAVATPTATAAHPSGGATAATPTPADDARPVATGSPAAAPAAAPGTPALAGSCALDPPAEVTVETVRLAYPEGWRVTEGCQWFDPVADSVEPGTEPDVAVGWWVSDSDYAPATRVEGEVRDATHFVGARAGYQASRIRGVSTGRGLREEGAPVLTWLVDLAPGTDSGGVLVGTAQPTDEVSFGAAAAALDRMAETITATPAAVPGDGPAVVTRRQVGERPYTVTLADGCFRLHDAGPRSGVVDERCDVPPVAPEGPATVLLDGRGDTTVLAGLAGPRASRVTAGDGSAAVTVSREGASAFAMRTGTPPLEVTVRDVRGQVLARQRVTG